LNFSFYLSTKYHHCFVDIPPPFFPTPPPVSDQADLVFSFLVTFINIPLRFWFVTPCLACNPVQFDFRRDDKSNFFAPHPGPCPVQLFSSILFFVGIWPTVPYFSCYEPPAWRVLVSFLASRFPYRPSPVFRVERECALIFQ